MLSPTQFRFAQSTVHTLRKQKDAYSFNQAVDSVALNTPHYLNIISKPVDLGTIDERLTMSNPAKKPEPRHRDQRALQAKTW